MPRVAARTPAPSERPRVPASTPLRTPAKAPRPVGKRPGRMSLLWRRQKRRLRQGLWALLAAAVVTVAVLAVRTVHPGSSIVTWREKAGAAIGLRVQKVVIEGREKTPAPMLHAALGVSVGDKLLGFSLDAARSRIEQLAWVESATVERRLPGTIVVSLVERRPFAVWQSDGRFVLIDRQGQMVAKQDPVKDATAFATLPLVVGAGAPEAAAALLDELARHKQLRARVVAAVRVGQRRWNLRLNTGADVLLPEGAAGAAMARLDELEASEKLLDRPLRTVDLRLADRLVVRPQTEPHTPPPPKRPT